MQLDTGSRNCVHCGQVATLATSGQDEMRYSENRFFFCSPDCRSVDSFMRSRGLLRLAEDQQYHLPKPRPSYLSIAEIKRLDSSTHAERLRQSARVHGTICEFVTLKILGPPTSGCQWALGALPLLDDGVIYARMDVDQMRLTLAIDPRLLLSHILHLVGRLGFEATFEPIVLSGKNGTDRKSFRVNEKVFDFPEIKLADLLVSLIGTLCLMGFGATISFWHNYLSQPQWFSILFFLPTLVYSLRSEWKFATSQITAYGITANIPPLVGILSGSTLGIIECFDGRWPASIEVISFFTTIWLVSEFYGWHLQQTFTKRISGLSSFLPLDVLKWDETRERFIKIPRELIRTNDRLLIEPGTRIPLNGIVSEGTSEIDVRVLTGNPKLHSAVPGFKVEPGMLNGRFPLEMKVSDTKGTLQELNSVITESMGRSRGGFYGFNRALCLLSILPVFLAPLLYLWADMSAPQAIFQMTMFSLITNPRLFLLILPSQLHRALVWARDQEFFIFNEHVFERLGRIKNIIMSHTGVLTTADFAVTSSITLVPSQLPIQGLILAMQKFSTHPIAHAIAAHLRSEGVQPVEEITDCQSQVGFGIYAHWRGHALKFAPIEGEAFTTVGFWVDRNLFTQFCLQDQVRESAPQALLTLEEDAKIMIASSDSDARLDATRRNVERNTGVMQMEMRGSQTPLMKQRLVQLYHPNLVIGANSADRLALSHSDVSIVMGGNLESSLGITDVYALDPNLMNVAKFIQFSKRYRYRLIGLTAMALSYHLVAFFLIMNDVIPFQLAAFLMPGTSLLIYFLIIPLRPDNWKLT
jgi:P-type E1-E2 ATPase